ncbi:MAG TPA: TonB-dependent receptor plug domain-containing protein [Bacteriovoracaceae bacterium]|nr:TonB-dependent receptor plug domain-containing protein [Bacteriovoracaceae bacterium]
MFWPIIILLSGICYAAEELDPVEVTATKELSEFHLGSSQSLQTETNSTVLLNGSVDDATGVVSSQNGGPGSRTSYFIRGTEARHVSFTIDNLKLNDPSNTDRQYDAAFLTTPFLRDITLYKGPQAVLFGSDAMGGLVDMRTRKGENAPETRATFNAGSFGTADASLSQDWHSKKGKGTLTWTSFRTDGISRLNKKRFNAKERDAADITQLTSSSTYSWNQKLETDLLVSFLRGNNELDGFMDDNTHDKSRGDQYLLQQRTHQEVSAHSTISLRNGFSRHQRNLKTLSVGENSFAGDLIQNELLFNFEKGDLKLITGVAIEKEQFEQSGANEYADLNSAFVQTSLKKGSFTWQGGLRADSHSRYGHYYTGSTGLSYEVAESVVALQFSQGFKAPSLYQLYADPLFGAPIGNKDLMPEKNNAVEARWTYGILDVAVFRNALSNIITFTNQGYRNQERFVAQGIELAADFKQHSFRLRPSMTMQEFKEEKTPVLRRPTSSLGLDASWFPYESLELFTKIRAFNHRNDIDENGSLVKLHGFETVSLGSKLSWSEHEYGVQVLNLTDREYEEVYAYSIMPRSLFFHYGISL